MTKPLDPRFAKLATDPRFGRPKANKHKIVVDDRFKHFFDQPEASTSKGKKSVKVDKYGRPVAADSEANDLKRYYRMENDGVAEKDEEEGDDDEEQDEEVDGSEESESEEDGAAGGKGFIDYARGEQLMESSDEEQRAESDEDDEDDQSEGSESDSDRSVVLGPAAARRRRAARSPSIDLSETEHPSAFPASDGADESAAESDSEGAEATRRMAIVNMDWDHLRAADLYRVMASSLSATAVAAPPPRALKPGKAHKFDEDGKDAGPYKPSSRLNIAKGRLLSLTIHPSQFGRERMEREAREGPPVEVFRAQQREAQEDEAEEVTEQALVAEQVDEGAEDYDREALRRYQLERLRYYYAIATFDTPDAAAHVYGEINGTEFERTANMFDLQYVPDETDFARDPVHDEATEASIAAEGAAYKGIDFTTDALRHSKVTLTWDQDDPHRKTKLQGFLAAAQDRGKGKGKSAADVTEAEIRAYIASSSEDEGEHAADDDDEPSDDFFEVAEGKKSKPQGRRDKLRSLFGLDAAGGDEDGEPAWDGGRKAKKGSEGGMQITFAPALSDQKGKKAAGGALDSDDDDRHETAIETYKRKEKERRERRKAEWKAKKEGKTLAKEGEEGPEFGGEDVGPGGFDDAFFADGADDDAFAAYDAGEVDSGDEIGAKKAQKPAGTAKLSKNKRKKMREAEERANKEAQASLALLVASDDENEGGAGGKHFDMKQILKAEKQQGKKGRKGKGKKAQQDESVPVVDDFAIDVSDERFKSLHEDYDFAIDPSNPKFQKTKNMDKLLEEGRKRRAKGNDPRKPVGGPVTHVERRQKRAQDDGPNLESLIESVKRKAAETGGRGKRTKVDE